MMIKRIYCLMAMLMIILAITGCGSREEAAATPDSALSRIEVEYSSEDLDGTWGEEATTILLHGSTYEIDGKGAAAEGKILTISEAGTYVLTGTLTEGQIIVEAGKEETVQLVLNGASLSSSESAAIYTIESEKTIITLAEGTVNSVSDGSTCSAYEGTDEPDSAIYSKSDLTINGTGALNVTGNYKDGITSKDDLVITGGILGISAMNDGIKGKDSIAVKDGTFTLNVKGDGLQSSNEEADKGWISLDGGVFDITAGDDGIHAETTLTVNGGTINVAASYEGMEASSITINEGVVNVTASDDGLNAAEMIEVNGGTVTVDADGDGIDSNGSIAFAGGAVYVNGPTNNGNGAMDYNGECVHTGGILAIAGSSGMAQSPGENSTQNSVTVYYTEVQPAGTLVSLTDEAGEVMFKFAPSKEYQSIVISTPELETGKTYALLSGQTELTRLTISQVITKISEDGQAYAGGQGGMGGKVRPEGVPPKDANTEGTSTTPPRQ